MYLLFKMKLIDFEMVVVWVFGSIYSVNWKYIVVMLLWFIILILFI